MTNELNDLVALAKKVEPTSEDREKQRRSFAYGNTRIENPRITWDMVHEQAERLKTKSD